MTLAPRDRLIAALDLPSLEAAEQLTRQLGDAVDWYKIGYQLFPLGGYDFARRLATAQKNVFLDLKLFDIGSTVERGVRSLRGVGARLLTVHADPDTIAGALQGRDDARLAVHAVTVLTSWNAESLKAHQIGGGVLDLVLRRAEMAAENGADGVIASAAEARAIRERFGDRLSIVTPGIRPKGGARDDQKRVVTPQAALEAGADRLVIGRPITAAADPVAAVRALLRDIG
ncbi:orotidine 5'-phosphate decarboxylase [Parvularcula bermudensis HTCC2503]|uniref:Orotidine 5'-phosphate decarboxylase n=1 Tax=Parvularcula bermudensis (strain ATCC BAA-594 / HTCC2503 / KCTC 12087) TaxID=314260 RepID=E0TEN5_PARBH|nr:orotidine-5'-phosphate decarboxylase [Parvularcula bermudensis]ADM08918.1 orotidine 5'-phosphate decarboxylase [Parvularcula bermudensis HTCC2503]